MDTMNTTNDSSNVSKLSIDRISFVGAGSMAEAIIRGLINTGWIASRQIVAVNRSNAERLQQLASLYDISIPTDEAARDQLITSSDIVVLAMKPKDAAQAIADLAPRLHERQLIISVIAGLNIGSLTRIIGKPLPIARTMPNTSSSIGLGATGISFSERVTDVQRQLAQTIFESVGIVRIVEEPLLDVVTGVSGSGPAYIYYVMEAMIRGGIECGLSPDAAKDLTLQTVLGAARMVQETGEEPAELRRKVTSPGGTTQAALELMASNDLQETISNAVKRAAERARELGAALEK